MFKLLNYVFRKYLYFKFSILHLMSNSSWDNSLENYVKSGLLILQRNFQTLQEYSQWLNNEISQFFINSKENFFDIFEITTPTLSRYLANKIGISKERGLVLLAIINQNLDIPTLIKNKIDEFGKKNWQSINTRLVLTDVPFLSFIVNKTILSWDKELSENIFAIVTPEADGIPFGVILAHFLNCKCIYVRKNKRAEENDFIHLEFQRYRNVVNYYLSLKELPKNSKCIVVDDIKRSGSTLGHITELVEKAGSKVIKKLVLIDVPSENSFENDVESLLKL